LAVIDPRSCIDPNLAVATHRGGGGNLALLHGTGRLRCGRSHGSWGCRSGRFHRSGFAAAPRYPAANRGDQEKNPSVAPSRDRICKSDPPCRDWQVGRSERLHSRCILYMVTVAPVSRIRPSQVHRCLTRTANRAQAKTPPLPILLGLSGGDTFELSPRKRPS
jgi:hypothetical protein